MPADLTLARRPTSCARRDPDELRAPGARRDGRPLRGDGRLPGRGRRGLRLRQQPARRGARSAASSGRSTTPASCPPTSARCSARARARSAGWRSRATRPTSPPPTGPCSRSSPTTRRWRAGSAWPASGSRSRACRRASAGSATASATGSGCASTRWSRTGELSAPIVIGRDHLDSGSVASPYRETEAMADGSDAIADWPLLNALVNTAVGRDVGEHPPRRRRRHRPLDPRRAWCASPTAPTSPREKLERVLTTDPGMGVIRHADAGYERGDRGGRRARRAHPDARGEPRDASARSSPSATRSCASAPARSTADELASPEVQALDRRPRSTRCAHANGAGLAANQVRRAGAHRRRRGRPQPALPLQAADPADRRRQPGHRAARRRDGRRSTRAACRCPTCAATSPRHVNVRVRYLDRDGAPHDEVKRGLTAGTFQHELDHLDGVLFLDRVARPDDAHDLGAVRALSAATRSSRGSPTFVGARSARDARYWCELAWLGGDAADGRRRCSRSTASGIASVTPGVDRAAARRGPAGRPHAARPRQRPLARLPPGAAGAHPRRRRARSGPGASRCTRWPSASTRTATTRLARATFAEMALAGITVGRRVPLPPPRTRRRPYADPNAMGEALSRRPRPRPGSGSRCSTRATSTAASAPALDAAQRRFARRRRRRAGPSGVER